jgi:hypothetical protein
VTPQYRSLCAGILKHKANDRGYGVKTFSRIGSSRDFGYAWFDPWDDENTSAAFYWGVRADEGGALQVDIPAEHWTRTHRWIERWLTTT